MNSYLMRDLRRLEETTLPTIDAETAQAARLVIAGHTLDYPVADTRRILESLGLAPDTRSDAAGAP